MKLSLLDRDAFLESLLADEELFAGTKYQEQDVAKLMMTVEVGQMIDQALPHMVVGKKVRAGGRRGGENAATRPDRDEAKRATRVAYARIKHKNPGLAPPET